jgi:hypothetical protein
MNESTEVSLTYLLVLDALDVERAEFTGPHGVNLSLPRSEWQAGGRTASLSLTLTADRGGQ